MIEIVFGSIIYTATFLGCNDGDSCKVRFDNSLDILEEQTIRFEGFDTPEMRGKCSKEKELAKLAKEKTINYMKNIGVVYSKGKRGKYGRILITAP